MFLQNQKLKKVYTIVFMLICTFDTKCKNKKNNFSTFKGYYFFLII